MNWVPEHALSLQSRVHAPERVNLPAAIAGVTWRPMTPADASAIHQLERVAGRVDHPGFVTTLEAFEHDLGRDEVDLHTDSLLGLADDGTVVAWAMTTLSPQDGDVVKVAVTGCVHPDWRGRGLGTAIMAWHDERGRQQLATSTKSLPGWLASYADERAGDRIALFESWGYDLRRWWLELERDLADTIVEVPLDPALRLQLYGPEWSEPTRLARNDVFLDHWGSLPTSAADWAATDALPIARPDLSWIAVDPATAEVVAFVLTSVNEEEWVADGRTSGYIEYVGVRRAWRGHGLARALLSRTMLSYRDAGLAFAILDVDSESPTGATALYSGIGFRPINRSVSLVKEL